MNPVLEKSYKADGAITRFAVVVSGTNEGEVKMPGSANAGKIMGIAQHDAGDGETVRVMMMGISYAIASGSVSQGDMVNIADTAGKVATAAPATGTNAFIVGVATEDAADGDQFRVLVVPSVMQGA